LSILETFATDLEGSDGTKFPRLRMKDYAELESAVRTNRSAVHTSLLNTAGLTAPSEKFVVLRDALAKDIAPEDVWDFLASRDGARRALAASLARAGRTGAEAADVIDAMPVREAVRIARAVTFYDPAEMKLMKDEADRLAAEAGNDPLTASGGTGTTSSI
jgi:hypothetical protein